MGICYVCGNRCFKKWRGTTKQGTIEWLCRTDGLLVGAKVPQLTDPLKEAEDQGLQPTIEDYV